MASATYRFSEFRLDPARRELSRGDEKRELPLRAFQCLLYLLENRDRAVSHDELIDQVWGGAHMSDGVVAQAILSARRALDDTAQEPRFIDTVRGFGYRWAAPVDVGAVESVEPPVGAPTAAPTSNVRPRWLWTALAILAFAALAAGAFYLQRHSNPGDTDVPPTPRGEGEIALLLPVTVEDDPDHAWIRLGLMDLIALRLREAGQAMVPSETVIALTSGSAEEPDEDGIKRLTETTGAHLVLAGRAQATGARWMVSLHTIHGAQPPLTAVGEAHDVLEAARAAADRLALVLELSPPAEPDGEPGLQLLLHQIEAARLAQQMDAARTLIENADPRLRRRPEVRFQRARIEFYSGRLDAANAALAPLLDEAPADRDPVLRARVLNGLAAVQALQGDWSGAEPIMEEVVALLDGRDTLRIHGTVRTNLGVVVLRRGAFTAARRHMGQARRIYQGIGDVDGLASVDLNVGVLEAQRERFARALHHFEQAAERHAAVQDVGGELDSRAYMIQSHLLLLDPPAAAALQPRVDHLLERTANPVQTNRARLAQVDLFDATGRWEAAETLLDDVLADTEDRRDLREMYEEALLRRAEHALRAGDIDVAGRMLRDVLERLDSDQISAQGHRRSYARLLLLRVQLAQGDLAGAAETSAAMAERARRGGGRSPRIYAALAAAELAAAERHEEAAAAAFERALVAADDSQVPRYMALVAGAYVPWLLRQGPDGAADPERALLVAEYLIEHADRHYDAALLQLRVYHALGPPSAWRAALDRVQSLAGERQLPPELLDAPDSTSTLNLPLAAPDPLSG